MNLIQRIDHWAAAAPEAIAHVSGDRTLTYGELRRRSDGLASYLTTLSATIADRLPCSGIASPKC